MMALKRLLAIALLAVCGLPFVSPLFGLSVKGSAGTADCCLHNGRHGCLKSEAEKIKATQHTDGWSPVQERCPYSPASFVIVHRDAFAVPVAQAGYAGWMSHPTVAAQTESKLRISQGRSRQKRGPPSRLSL